MRRISGLAAVAVGGTALAWLAAWWLHGPVSLGLAAALALATPALPVALFWRAWRSRADRSSAPAQRHWSVLLAGVSAFVALWLCLLVAVLLRGEFHQTDPNRRENLISHPYLGHAVMVLPEQAAQGLSLDGSVGQRLERPDPGRQQVVLLGDSVLYGWGVEDSDSPGPALAKHIRGMQVLNASVSGYSLDQYLMYLERIAPLLDPAVIVIGIYAGNDYESSGTSQWHGHSKPLFLPDEDGGLRLWRQEVPWYDCVDLLSGSFLWTFLWRSPDFGEAVLNALCRPKELPVGTHEEVIRRTFEALSALAARVGAQILFVLLPDRNDFCADSPYHTKERKYDRLEALLREGTRDVFFFRDALDLSCDEAALLYLADDAAHFNAAGLSRLAASLASELTRRYGLE
jgi:lysophospholipase L1-like esterase